MTKSVKYTWNCGCNLITEPYSFYQWHPCKIHENEDMVKVLESLGKKIMTEELKSEPLKIEIVVMLELWEQALNLEHYIRKYVPVNCKESLQTYSFVPFVAEKDFIACSFGCIPEKFSRGDFKEAIISFFDEEK